MTGAPRVVLLDYGSGNVHSAGRALAAAGADVTLTSDRDAALAADGLVVPGVGAFAACMEQLRAVGGDEIIAARSQADHPTLGICVGHQVLFGTGVEHGVTTPGCGLFDGTITRLDAPVLPHMGWNLVEPPAGSRLFAGVERERFYFVHSYAAHTAPAAAQTTWCTHGDDRFVAALEAGPLASTQFHPEKSGAAGGRLLRNWVDSLS